MRGLLHHQIANPNSYELGFFIGRLRILVNVTADSGLS